MAAQNQGAPAKGKDAKKDVKPAAGKPVAKGAVVADDKNCP